jgi:hypothetical protein
MTEERFPYETSTWAPQEAEKQKRWYDALERSGPENVRARLAQDDAGSRGAMSFGIESVVTKGFAEEWLAWHDRQRSQRESSFRGTQIFWTRWAALAATVAAIATAAGWFITTVWRKG